MYQKNLSSSFHPIYCVKVHMDEATMVTSIRKNLGRINFKLKEVGGKSSEKRLRRE